MYSTGNLITSMTHSINDLNVLETGNGPLTLIFLHYFGGSALEWQEVMSQLADRYRCVAIDLRGHGNSTGRGRYAGAVADESTGYAVDDMADDVIGVVEALAIREFVLIGHSMSGKVALAIAAAAGAVPANQPAQGRLAGLRQLLLVSPSPPVPEPIPDDERQKLIVGYGQRSAAEQRVKNTTAVSVSETVQQQIITDDLRTAEPAWMAWLNAGSREDISPRMAIVAVPVHILVGTEDQALPPDVQTRLVLPYLKTATLETINGAGHLLPWEVPDELSAFIAKKVTV